MKVYYKFASYLHVFIIMYQSSGKTCLGVKFVHNLCDQMFTKSGFFLSLMVGKQIFKFIETFSSLHA